jgi:hypothetical protein
MEEGIFQASRAATTTQDGNVELATGAEMTAGTDTARVPSVKVVADYVIAATSGLGGSLDADLVAIGALAPANDDIIQRKSGVWTNRTLAQYKTDLALNNVSNTSDATKWAATATLTNKAIDGVTNTLTNIPQTAVVGLESALADIPAPEGIMRYVKWTGSAYPNRSTSGTTDPTIPVFWFEGNGPAITGSGATGAITGVDYWVRTT